MKFDEFLEASLEQLETISGIDKTRWCKYFNGFMMNERNIYRFADSINMPPGEFIEALNARRERTIASIKSENDEDKIKSIA